MKLETTLGKAARVLAAVLLSGAIAVPARAYTAAAGLRYVDLDFRGNRGQVQEYDGAYYKGVHGDVLFANEGAFGVLDLGVKNIGSTEERAAFGFDYYNGLKVSAKWENMHHRLNFIRTGIVTNGYYAPDNNYVMDIERELEMVMRRTESELIVSKTSLTDARHWFGVSYWRVDKVGSTVGQVASYIVGRANVDNTKQDVTLGLGVGAGQTGQVAVDVVRSEFDDHAVVVRRVGGQGNILKPHYSASEMTGTEVRFRFDPKENLAVTGALTGRRRHALQNDYSNDTAVAAFNAAYRPTKKLSLLGKVYLRGNQVNESQTFKSIIPTQAPNRSQLDKNQLRTDLSATYRPTDHVSLKGAYRFEFIHRRDPESEIYTTGYWADGYSIPAGEWYNDIAGEETRHIVSLGTKAELPLGIEAEATVKRLQANRAAFVNQPTWQDDFSAGLSVPLPADLEFTLLGAYVKERNKAHTLDRNYSAMRNTYRAGLDGSLFSKVFFGADASYELQRYYFDASFGSPQAAPPGTTYRMPGMPNYQNNTTAGLHARALLPKGFALNGNGSYTWSRVSTPLNYRNTGLNYTVDDYTPYDIRVARGTVGLDYTPERFKDWTARASYTVNDWVDKRDNNNTGRVSITQLGVSAKF